MSTLTPSWKPDTALDAPDVFAIDDQASDLVFLHQAFCDNAKGLRFLGTTSALHGIHCVQTWCVRPGAGLRLILIDIAMPVITGFDLLSRFKSEPACRSIPIAIWTSSLRPKDHLLARQLGAVEVYVKPLRKEAMERFARDLFARVRRPEDDQPTRRIPASGR